LGHAQTVDTDDETDVDSTSDSEMSFIFANMKTGDAPMKPRVHEHVEERWSGSAKQACATHLGAMAFDA